MKRLMWISTASLVVLTSALFAPTSRAGDLAFSISSRYVDHHPEVVQNWGRRYPNPDDLAIFLQICAQSRVSPQIVFNYRSRGLSWYDVGVRVGVPVRVWYVPVRVDPGWAYGHHDSHSGKKHYKKHHKKHGH